MYIERQLQKGKYVVVILLITSLLITSNFLVQSSNGFTKNQRWISSEDDLSVVEQIFIHGNSDFLLIAQYYGWPGQGTFENPILIKQMNFSKNANMFSVSNTDLHFQFSNNRLNGILGDWCAIVLYNVSNAVISDNVIFNAAVGVHAIRLSESLITNNHVYRSGVGVTIENQSHDNMISHNFFDDLIECGIWSIGYCHNNIFYGNEINGGWEGIYLARNSNNNTISNNRIYNCDNYGIWLMTANNSVISNEIFLISGNGISLWDSGNEVIGNLIYNNTKYGILLTNNVDNSIIRNNTVIFNSSWGLLLDSGQHTTVENNDFIDSMEPDQVCDDGTENRFVSNYWHIWIGNDSNSDDIIDNPYTINGTANSIDNYPAAFPNTQLPDWYNFSGIQQLPSEPTNPSSQSTVEENSPAVSSELFLGIGFFVVCIIPLSYFLTKKRKI